MAKRTSESARWRDNAFLAEKLIELKRILEGKADQGQIADFRGMTFGQHDSFKTGLRFIGKAISSVDFRNSKIECPFCDSKFANVQFAGSKLAGCDMLKARFDRYDFSSCRISNALCNDAMFVQCSFRKCAWQGSMSQNCGGKRLSFIECDFTGCTFRQIEFRATKFVNCEFADAKFIWCELAHVRFEGKAPDSSQFEEVDTNRVLEWLGVQGASMDKADIKAAREALKEEGPKTL